MLYIGDILNPHGLKGAFIVFSHTRPAHAVAGYLRWFVGKTEDDVRMYDVSNCHQHGKKMRAILEGVESIEQAQALKGMKIWIADEDVQRDDDEYLWDELIGCKVIDQDGETLGEVSKLQEFGAQDIIEIHTLADAKQQGEWLLPFIEDVVLEVDMEQALIRVHLLEGMEVCFTPRS
ncbi:MAG: ribosome maturation factor RimM [Ghiorsea sp.]